MQTAIEFSIDDSILLSLKTQKNEFAQILRFYTAVALYQQKKLSLGKAAELSGNSRLDFIDKLRLNKQNIFDYETEIVEEMVDKADILLARLK
jgi:predicted HTH domain antitoxin